MSTKKKLLEAAAGNAGGEAVYVDDVFSTYLYDGTGFSQIITNGIDLAERSATKLITFGGTNKYVTGTRSANSSGAVAAMVNLSDVGGTNTLTSFSSTGSIEWGISAGINPTVVRKDDFDNVYIAGVASSKPYFAKFNSSGNLVWDVDFTGAGTTGRDVFVDGSGNVYCCFNGGTSPESTHIAKLNSSGVVQWEIRYSDATVPMSQPRIWVDNSGNVYLGDRFNGVNGMMVAKFNSTGAFQWGRSLSQSTSTLESIVTDSSGNVYASGTWFNGARTELWLVKFNSSGTLQYSVDIDFSVSGSNSKLGIDANDNLYMVCLYNSNAYLAQINTSTGAIVTQVRAENIDPTKQSLLDFAFGVSSTGKIVCGGGVDPASSTDYQPCILFLDELSTCFGVTGRFEFSSVSFSSASNGASASVSEYTTTVTSLTTSNPSLTWTSQTVTPLSIDETPTGLGIGGLVWIKGRGPTTFNHILEDTERGADRYLRTNTTNAELIGGGGVTAFNPNGFTTGTNGAVTTLGEDYASWTFRKQPGFFDVVTYTGDGVAGRTVSHNLGSVPGMIIVKRLESADEWTCYHRSVGATKWLGLNQTASAYTSSSRWNDTEPTDSVFTVGTDTSVNRNTSTYVAYLFAHDAQDFGTDSDESIIKCGSYTGNGQPEGPFIDLGFEPQWLLIKSTTAAGNWTMLDNMRGLTGENASTFFFRANDVNAEQGGGYARLSPTGFNAMINSSYTNSSGVNYIYVAIRRPMKTPESGAEVFTPTFGTGSGFNFVAGFPVDMAIIKDKTSVVTFYASARLTSGKVLETTEDSIEFTNAPSVFDSQVGYYESSLGSNFIGWLFKRATGFFDVVTYTGSLSNQNVPHNLGAVPEMMIFKRRNVAADWAVYHSAMGNDKALALNTDYSYLGPNYGVFNNTTPTASVFTVGANYATTNNDGRFYVSYLFASVSGISKVGSYTGTGNDITVDCGFSSGARFVLIKRWDRIGGTFGVNGDWYLWDSVRGIVAGNDPYLLLNSTAAEVTSTDYIDPLSSGFTITSSAPAALNASGGSYIFLAIA